MANITVVQDPEETTRFIIEYAGFNEVTQRSNCKRFYLNTYKYKKKPDLALIRLAAEHAIGAFKPELLFDGSFPVHHVKSLVGTLIKNALKSPKAMIRLQRKQVPAKEEEEESAYLPTEARPKNGIFYKKASDSGRTKLILGSSFSGKTHFLVEQLNRLPLDCYDRIFLFTESPNAEPLKKLNPRLNIKIITGYIPKIVNLLRKINFESNNAFQFLVILDDVVSGIRKGTMVKQLLTMRNSNISTCMLLQYPKLITPAMRNSVHDVYVTQLRADDWVFMLKNFIGALIAPYFNESNYNKLNELIKAYMQPMERVLHFDQVHDTIAIFEPYG